MESTNPLRYLLLYIPFFLAWLFESQPHIAYIIAYVGSYFIFYLCYSGFIKKLPNDLPYTEQLLRPIFLMQIIFAGYMCCTSIFYYLNAIGYQYGDYIGSKFFRGDIIYGSIAKIQSYYVLGHAALVTGILAAMRYPIENRHTVYVASMSNLLLAVSITCLPLSSVFSKIGGLNQFSIQLSGLSFVAGTIALAFAIREKKRMNIILSGALFGINLLQSLGSGFKEPIIISVLLLGVYLFPIYGKKVVPVFGILMLGLFFVLPTFIGNFRALSMSGISAEDARDQSIDVFFENDNIESELKENNWAFLTLRLSEMDMFIKYVNSTPYYVPFYNLTLVQQSFKSLIPRVMWKSKPDIEVQVMQRTYTAGVVSRDANVSAKPAFIVDSYLSRGIIGIIIGLFLYGYIAQWISIKAETLFGGYFLGTAVMFAGLFQIFWRGNSFEFMFNSIFWSFITMYIIYSIFKARGILTKVF
ncbi:hypothetical protein WG904_00330 [Pedobacter sp. Du54]|uniref:exosortase Y-associated Wzy-like protein n=1 Tax=Pedobacter anseongensis TaxID=3133439 RepID=UPI0030A28AA9